MPTRLCGRPHSLEAGRGSNPPFIDSEEVERNNWNACDDFWV